MTTKMTGTVAIEYAEAHGMTLSKYADPTEGARTGLTIDEARDVAKEDPGLIWLAAAGTTAETITDEQIRALRTESAEAGDDRMADICTVALDERDHAVSHEVRVGYTTSTARAECARVIADAEAQG